MMETQLFHKHVIFFLHVSKVQLHTNSLTMTLAKNLVFRAREAKFDFLFRGITESHNIVVYGRMSARRKGIHVSLRVTCKRKI